MIPTWRTSQKALAALAKAVAALAKAVTTLAKAVVAVVETVVETVVAVAAMVECQFGSDMQLIEYMDSDLNVTFRCHLGGKIVRYRVWNREEKVCNIIRKIEDDLATINQRVEIKRDVEGFETSDALVDGKTLHEQGIQPQDHLRTPPS